MLKHFIAAIFIGLIAFVGYLFTHLGVFTPVEISEGEAPPMRLLYKEHTGAYHKIVPVIEEVEAWAKSKNIDCSLSFGEYIDKPSEVEEERLRSRGGCVIPQSMTKEEVFEKNPPAEFKLQDYAPRKSVNAIFKGSPSIGPWKVYSKVFSYLDDSRRPLTGPVIETYQVISNKEMTTTYYFPTQ